jgi:hypothetical protein
VCNQYDAKLLVSKYWNAFSEMFARVENEVKRWFGILVLSDVVLCERHTFRLAAPSLEMHFPLFLSSFFLFYLRFEFVENDVKRWFEFAV